MRAILTYHSIDPSGSPISVAAADLERHVRSLAERGVRVVPLEALATVPAGEEALAITFDDAFANFADQAWPRLRDAGFPVTVFVVSDHAGGDNVWGGTPVRDIPRLPLLSWDALARLADEGLALGNHSCTHPRLSDVSAAQLDDELDRAHETIRQRTGVAPRAFAYPFGDWAPRVRDAVARRYEVAVTTELRDLRVGEDARLLPRLDAFYWRGRSLDDYGRGSFRRRLRLRAFARRARALMTPRR